MKKENSTIRLLTLLIVFCLGFSLFGVNPVSAQSATTLSITPATQTVCVGSDIYLNVWVGNVADLWAYDVRMSFTPGTVEVVSLTNGGFISPDQLVLRTINNTTGTIRLAYTQSEGRDPKTGSGNLITIRLRAINTGSPVGLTILTTSEIVIKAGPKIPYTVTGGGTITTDACGAPPLSISAPTPAASRCRISTVTVDVTNVQDLYGYQLSLTFNPAVIEIVSVENGGFIVEGLFPSYTFNNTTGTILAYTAQVDPSPPVSGSGTLIKITLRGKVENQTTTLAIKQSQTVLTDIDSYQIPYTFTGRTITTDACDPTAVELDSFSAERAKWAINLKWVTISETDNLGFNIYRAASPYGPKHKVNKELISTLTYPGSLVGSEYSYVDKTVVPGKVYYYWLQDVDIYGHKTMHGPIKVLKFNPLKR